MTKDYDFVEVALADLEAIVDYLYDDELQDFIAENRPADHVFHIIARLATVVDNGVDDQHRRENMNA